MLDPAILIQAVMHFRDGVTISDATQPDNPLIYVNKAFEEMTGYSSEEAINRNCRYLQGKYRNQRSIKIIREAVENAKSCLVTLRNYRKDGSVFWNEISISPIFDTNGKLTNFISVQKDITARVERDQLLSKERKSLQESKAKLVDLVILDSLTGIYNRRHFETQLIESWQFLTNTHGNLTIMMVDIDYFKPYNDTYGHIAGDKALINVAKALTGCMKRDTDFTARYGGEEFVVLANEMTKQEAVDYGNTLCNTVKNLMIPHMGSPFKILTVSCGIAHVNLVSSINPRLLLLHADEALYEAKEDGRNKAIIYDKTRK